MFCQNFHRLPYCRPSVQVMLLNIGKNVKAVSHPALCLRSICIHRKHLKINTLSQPSFLYHWKTLLDGTTLPKTVHITNYQLRCLQTSNSLHNEESGKNEDEEHKQKFKVASVILGLCGATVLILTLFLQSVFSARSVHMHWDLFVQEILSSGEVKRVFIEEHNGRKDKVIAILHNGATFDNRTVNKVETSIKGEKNIEERLRDEERKLGIDPVHFVPVTIYEEGLLTGLPIFAIYGLTLVVVSVFTYRWSRKVNVKVPKKKPNSPPMDPFNPGSIFRMFDTDVGYAKKTNVKFSDVAGMHEAKQEVMEFVQFLKNPTIFKKLGAKMPHGCLLTGPPGVGKTLLAKAVASESDVPFIAKAGSDFVEMIGGLGARRIRQVFQKARESAPCIIYIDELDALGAQRSGTERFSSASSEKDQTLNQILVEMDGMLSKQHQVIVLASTNRADILDKALLRPGRFDRLVHIDLPTRIERKEILDKHLESVKLKGAPSDYSDQLASETPGMSGADLANICNEAAIYAAREGDDIVERKHLDYALERVTTGAPKSTTSLSPEERKKVAIHEAGHALVGWLLEHTNALAKISIIPRSSGALGVTRTLPTEQHLRTPEQLFDNMCMALGGRAAENLIFGHVTQGAQDDLQKVTNIAYAQVKKFGFNAAVGPLSFQDEDNLQVRPYSDALQTVIDVEVQKLVSKAYDATRKLLKDNKSKLEKLSDELLSRETLTYDDVVKLIGAPTYGEKSQIRSVPFNQEDVTKAEEPS